MNPKRIILFQCIENRKVSLRAQWVLADKISCFAEILWPQYYRNGLPFRHHKSILAEEDVHEFGIPMMPDRIEVRLFDEKWILWISGEVIASENNVEAHCLPHNPATNGVSTNHHHVDNSESSQSYLTKVHLMPLRAHKESRSTNYKVHNHHIHENVNGD